MEIKTRSLNKGETFCCSIKKAKEIFKDTDVVLNFAFTNRNFGTFMNTPDFYYVKKNIKGRVIASMYLCPENDNPLISFFAVQEALFDKNLKQIFEKKYLPKFYNLYINRDSNSLKRKAVLIEFTNGVLKEHEVKF